MRNGCNAFTRMACCAPASVVLATALKLLRAEIASLAEDADRDDTINVNAGTAREFFSPW